MHEIYTEKRRLSTTYPHGFPHSVENYMGVDEQAKARKRPTSAYGRSAFLIRIKDNLTIEKNNLPIDKRNEPELSAIPSSSGIRS